MVGVVVSLTLIVIVVVTMIVVVVEDVLGVLVWGEGLWGRWGDVVTVGVDGLSVAFEVHLALERLLAEATGEGLVPGVLPHVGDEVGRLTERLAAHHAFVGLLSCGKKYICRQS